MSHCVEHFSHSIGVVISAHNDPKWLLCVVPLQDYLYSSVFRVLLLTQRYRVLVLYHPNWDLGYT